MYVHIYVWIQAVLYVYMLYILDAQTGTHIYTCSKNNARPASEYIKAAPVSCRLDAALYNVLYVCMYMYVHMYVYPIVMPCIYATVSPLMPMLLVFLFVLSRDVPSLLGPRASAGLRSR